MTAKIFVGLTTSLCLLIMALPLTATDLSGGWKGTLMSTDGSQAEVQIDFSPQGFPLYAYTNNKGVVRQVELSHVGQTVEYVPRGGGVQRMVVKSLEKDRADCRLELSAPLNGRARVIWISDRKSHSLNIPSRREV